MSSAILIIEDSRTVRIVIGRHLKAAGHLIAEADTAEKAFELLMTDTFELVIADINLPQMDGVTFLRKLRESPKSQLAKLPVLILTGDASDELRKQCAAAGANGFISKPISEQSLLTAVTSAMQQ
jgi:two-component system chemotaxis response regulator CheY